MTASSALDPRAPLVLDTRELGRRPGTMRHVQRTINAPGDWLLELVRVPAGSPETSFCKMPDDVPGAIKTSPTPLWSAIMAASSFARIPPVAI